MDDTDGEGARAGAGAARADERGARGFSPITLVGAIGGLCLVGAFVTPLFVLDPAKARDNEAAALLRDYQRQLASVRRQIEGVQAGTGAGRPELQAVAPIVGPAAEHVLEFIDAPSLYNLTFVARDARELLPVVALLEPAEAANIAKARLAVTAFLVFMFAIPAIGLYPVVRGILRGFRKQGTAGLVLTFFSGLVYLTIGALIFLGIPEAARGQLGPAIALLTLGGGLAVFCGIFGVSRSTWWKAYLLYAAGIAAAVYAVVELTRDL